MNKNVFPSFLTILLVSFLFIFIQGTNALTVVEPPAVIFESEPVLVVIPGTDIFYVSKDDNDLFFYQDYWWRPWHDSWYRSEIYSGPWVLVGPGFVPFAIINLPEGWRYFPPDIEFYNWGDVRWHWRDWDHDGFRAHHEWREHHGDFHHRDFHNRFQERRFDDRNMFRHHR